MKTYEVIARRVNDRGISVAELARRIGMNSELLRRCLVGERKIVSDELIALCIELELDIPDFVSAA